MNFFDHVDNVRAARSARAVRGKVFTHSDMRGPGECVGIALNHVRMAANLVVCLNRRPMPFGELAGVLNVTPELLHDALEDYEFCSISGAEFTPLADRLVHFDGVG